MQAVQVNDEEVPDASFTSIPSDINRPHLSLSHYHQRLQRQQHEQSPRYLRPQFPGRPRESSSVSSGSVFSSVEDNGRSSPLLFGAGCHTAEVGEGSNTSSSARASPSTSEMTSPQSAAVGANKATSSVAPPSTQAQPLAERSAASEMRARDDGEKVPPKATHVHAGRNGTLMPTQSDGALAVSEDMFTSSNTSASAKSHYRHENDDNALASTSKLPMQLSIPMPGISGPSFDELTTPEAQWNSSASVAQRRLGGQKDTSLGQSLPISSDTSLGDHGLYDTSPRPYTPSYNSLGSFSDAYSDHDSFLRSVASQLGADEFDLESLGGTGAKDDIGPTFAYDPDTADSYHPLDSSLLSQSFLGGTAASTVGRSRTLRQSLVDGEKLISSPRQSPSLLTLSGGTGALATPTALTETDKQFRPSSPSVIATSSAPLASSSSLAQQQQQQIQLEAQPSSLALPRAAPHSSESENHDHETDLALQQMQALGQRMTIQDPVQAHNPMLGISSSALQDHYQHQPSQGESELRASDEQHLSQRLFQQGLDHQETQSGGQQHDASDRHPLFEPVFEDEPAEIDSTSGGVTQAQQLQQQASATFPAYTYLQPTSLDASFPDLSVFAPHRDDTMRAADHVGHGPPTLAQSKAERDGWQTPSTSAEYGNTSSRLAWDYGSDGYTAQPQHGHAMSNPFAVPSAHHAQQHAFGNYQQQQAGETDPKRQDSLERVRRFLRLDVDMGAVVDQDEPFDAPMPQRKRSNSDVGPAHKDGDGDGAASPSLAILPGAMSERTPIATSSGVDWTSETAKQRRPHQLQTSYTQSGTLSDSCDMIGNAHGSSMDPHLMQQQQQFEQQAIQRMQQQAQNLQQHQQDPASGPMRSRENSSNRGQVPYYHTRTPSSSSMAPFEQMPAALSRTSSARSRRSHSRYPQSDDYNSIGRFLQGQDGALMGPPSQLSGPTGLMRNGMGRMDGCLDGLQRPPSAPHVGMLSSEMNMPSSWSRYATMRPSSSASSSNMSVPVQQQAFFSQDPTPTYSTLHNVSSHSLGKGAAKYDAEAGTPGTFPIVAQVTTSATQAASASRRKNEAIHVCPIPGCGSTFTRKFNLNGHIRSHTGSRPYQCKAAGCGKSFARSFDLSRHEKLHAGIKPHTCETCGKAFARADALSRHLRHDAGTGGCAARFGEEEGDENSMSGTMGPSSGADGVKTMLPTLSEADDEGPSNEFSGIRMSSNGYLTHQQQPAQSISHEEQQQQQQRLSPPPPAPAPGSAEQGGPGGGFSPLWTAPARRDARFRGQIL